MSIPVNMMFYSRQIHNLAFKFKISVLKYIFICSYIEDNLLCVCKCQSAFWYDSCLSVVAQALLGTCLHLSEHLLAYHPNHHWVYHT